MNIQRQKKLGSNLFLLLLLCSTLGCGGQKIKMAVTEIYTGVKIKGNEYIYSKESTLQLDGQMYSLREKAIYCDDGTIEKLIIYKPEGVLEYTKEDIIKDKNILEIASLPFSQNWYYSDGKFVKGNNHVKVEKIDSVTLKFEQGNRIILYKIN